MSTTAFAAFHHQVLGNVRLRRRNGCKRRIAPALTNADSAVSAEPQPSKPRRDQCALRSTSRATGRPCLPLDHALSVALRARSSRAGKGNGIRCPLPCAASARVAALILSYDTRSAAETLHSRSPNTTPKRPWRTLLHPSMAVDDVTTYWQYASNGHRCRTQPTDRNPPGHFDNDSDRRRSTNSEVNERCSLRESAAAGILTVSATEFSHRTLGRCGYRLPRRCVAGVHERTATFELAGERPDVFFFAVRGGVSGFGGRASELWWSLGAGLPCGLASRHSGRRAGLRGDARASLIRADNDRRLRIESLSRSWFGRTAKRRSTDSSSTSCLFSFWSDPPQSLHALLSLRPSLRLCITITKASVWSGKF
jgi:hypothetical protein